MGKRTRSQRKGSSPKYRVSSHRFGGNSTLPRVTGEMVEVTGIEHSAAHTAPLAVLKLADGSEAKVVATEGMAVGQTLAVGGKVSLKPGNITELSQIPEGTPINNVELRPGDGGRFARSGGNSATVETRMTDVVRVRLPSGRLKDLPARCRAAIGVLAGGGRAEKPLMRAGAAFHKAKAKGKAYPTVSGVAMNPVDHPHGGGNHQAVHGPNSVARGAPPGQKVGHIAPSRTGRGRSRKE